tara:strand:- start:41728 stop:41943 length:216 start_codon:yes stop_codon:yes gene_type:complete
MTPDVDTEDYFGMSPNAVQEIMHRDKAILDDAVKQVQDMMPEADGKDWSFKAFHYLTAINILIQAINKHGS